MNLLYVARLSVLDSALGVLKKIEAQSEGLKITGINVEVHIFYLYESKTLDEHVFPFYFNFHRYEFRGMRRPFQLLDLWERISRLVQKPQFNLVYFRYPGSSYFTYNLLKTNSNRIIFEHNTKELEEIKLRSKRPRFDIWQEKFFARKSFKYCLGNVGMASEFTEHQRQKINYTLNLSTVTNGISVKDFKIKQEVSVNANEPIKIIFVGNTSVWHGLERILEGIKNYNGQRSFKLLLVGKRDKFIELIKNYSLEHLLNNEIILYGFTSGKELDVLFDQSHFAVGSLGLHRIDIFNGVPLKHREYLAKGIPFIYSGKDEDVNGEIRNYLYNIKPNENPVDIKHLFAFIEKIYQNNKGINQELRSYATQNVEMNVKMQQLKIFLKNCLSKE